ncbi:prolactin family 7 subfamily a member 2 [Cricetulus griseus]
MLLVSNLLLSEKVASMPMNVSEAGRSEVSLKDLFDNATILSENITKLSTDMRMEFVSTSLVPGFSLKGTSQMMSALHWSLTESIMLQVPNMPFKCKRQSVVLKSG